MSVCIKSTVSMPFCLAKSSRDGSDPALASMRMIVLLRKLSAIAGAS